MSRLSARRMRVGAGALGLLAAVGCAPSDAPAGVGMSAPDVTALTLAGDTVALSSFRGEPLLLNLWATWCVPCRRETPYLQALHRRWSEAGLRVVGISLDQRGFGREVRKFIDEFGVTYTVLRDPDMVVSDRYAVAGLPATFLIERTGTIRHAVLGPLEEGDRKFEAALREILE